MIDNCRPWPRLLVPLAGWAGCDTLKDRRNRIMTINLSKELEKFVHDAVRAGYYAREDDVIRDALTRLKQAMPEPARTPVKRTRRAKPSGQKVAKPLGIEELHQQMIARGLITQLPDTAADFDDPDDEPIAIEGEPLSETVIRERR
jgi:Arc/MetJ-type ribon-helix-helix transcriptional regulator